MVGIRLANLGFRPNQVLDDVAMIGTQPIRMTGIGAPTDIPGRRSIDTQSMGIGPLIKRSTYDRLQNMKAANAQRQQQAEQNPNSRFEQDRLAGLARTANPDMPQWGAVTIRAPGAERQYRVITPNVSGFVEQHPNLQVLNTSMGQMGTRPLTGEYYDPQGRIMSGYDLTRNLSRLSGIDQDVLGTELAGMVARQGTPRLQVAIRPGNAGAAGADSGSAPRLQVIGGLGKLPGIQLADLRRVPTRGEVEASSVNFLEPYNQKSVFERTMADLSPGTNINPRSLDQGAPVRVMNPDQGMELESRQFPAYEMEWGNLTGQGLPEQIEKQGSFYYPDQLGTGTRKPLSINQLLDEYEFQQDLALSGGSRANASIGERLMAPKSSFNRGSDTPLEPMGNRIIDPTDSGSVDLQPYPIIPTARRWVDSAEAGDRLSGYNTTFANPMRANEVLFKPLRQRTDNLANHSLPEGYTVDFSRGTTSPDGQTTGYVQRLHQVGNDARPQRIIVDQRNISVGQKLGQPQPNQRQRVAGNTVINYQYGNSNTRVPQDVVAVAPLELVQELDAQGLARPVQTQDITEQVLADTGATGQRYLDARRTMAEVNDYVPLSNQDPVSWDTDTGTSPQLLAPSWAGKDAQGFSAATRISAGRPTDPMELQTRYADWDADAMEAQADFWWKQGQQRKTKGNSGYQAYQASDLTPEMMDAQILFELAEQKRSGGTMLSRYEASRNPRINANANPDASAVNPQPIGGYAMSVLDTPEYRAWDMQYERNPKVKLPSASVADEVVDAEGYENPIAWQEYELSHGSTLPRRNNTARTAVDSLGGDDRLLYYLRSTPHPEDVDPDLRYGGYSPDGKDYVQRQPGYLKYQKWSDADTTVTDGGRYLDTHSDAFDVLNRISAEEQRLSRLAAATGNPDLAAKAKEMRGRRIYTEEAIAQTYANLEQAPRPEIQVGITRMTASGEPLKEQMPFSLEQQLQMGRAMQQSGYQRLTSYVPPGYQAQSVGPSLGVFTRKGSPDGNPVVSAESNRYLLGLDKNPANPRREKIRAQYPITMIRNSIDPNQNMGLYL